MAQRFNAPPGWNVPPNFVPAADWQPDPSWPPAPQGWTYWVEAAAPVTPAAYGTPAAPGAYEVPAAPAYGAVPSDAPIYGSPSGSFDPAAAASSQAAFTQGQYAAGRKSIFIGLALIVGGVIFTIVVFNLGYWSTWMIFLPVLGIVNLVRGSIEMNKAKKAMALQAPSGFSGNPAGLTPPGQGPPGTY